MKKIKIGKDLQREIITHVTQQYGFEEFFNLKESTNDSEEIVIKTIKKGVFKDKEGHMGIFCRFINLKETQPSIRSYLTNKSPILNVYEGEKFLLCLTDNKIYSFNIDYYRTIISILNEIEVDFPMESKKFFIGTDDRTNINALIIETDIANFAIAALFDQSQEEEERVILSKKLEESQPFFKFKAPIYFNWDSIIGDKDRQFERICELLLQKENNISRIIPIGKTRASDRGRDFEVIERIESFKDVTEYKWLVQCKYSENSISPSTIAGWTDRVIEHNYHGYWLMTNNDITPNLFDQFKDVEQNEKYNIKVKFWQRNDFYIKLNVNSGLFLNNDIFQFE